MEHQTLQSYRLPMGDIIARTGADYEAVRQVKRPRHTPRAIISPVPIKLRTGDNAMHLAVGAGLFAEKGLSLLTLFREAQFSLEEQSVGDSVVNRMPEFEKYLPDEVKHGAFDKPLVREIE